MTKTLQAFPVGSMSEIVPKGTTSNNQEAIAEVEPWSTMNKLQLNAKKCKELIIDFKFARSEFDPIVIITKELCIIENAKILGVTTLNKLQGNNHINNTIKKAKGLYFLVLLRRAEVSPSDLIRLYSTCIRPVLEYCLPMSRNAIPEYLSNDLEGVQNRAL